MTTLTEFEAITAAVDAIQAINLGTGDPSVVIIENAPTLSDYPNEMQPAYLPCAIVIPSEGATVSYGSDKRTTRNFQIRVYVAPTALNIPGEAITNSYLLLQALVQKWLDRISSTSDQTTLSNTGGIKIDLIPYQQQPFADTGVISDLVWTDEEVNYWGFEITLGVYIQWPINC